MAFSPPVRRLRRIPPNIALSTQHVVRNESHATESVALQPLQGEQNQASLPEVVEVKAEATDAIVPATVHISENKADVAAIYGETVRLLRWGASASAGYTVIFKLLCSGPVNPFKGLETNGRAGQRLHITVTTRDGTVYNDQAILTYFGDDSRKGMTIALKLATISGEHPFQGFPDGDKDGCCFLLRAWLVLDDERFVERAPRSFGDLTPTAQACIKCTSPNFQQFCIDAQETLARIAQFTPLSRSGLSNADYAKQTIYAFCGISSRSVLGRSGVEGVSARAKWKAMMEIEAAF